MGTKFITISRSRVDRNFRLGASLPVIRLEEGDATTLGGDVQIDGASRVVYRPGQPRPNGAEVWVETEADVKQRPWEPAAEPRPIPQRVQSAMSRMHDSDFFATALAKWRQRVASAPSADRESALRKLAELCRRSGDLDEAAECYRQIVQLSPQDIVAQRLLGLLEGRDPIGRSPRTWPASFARVNSFLGESRLHDVLGVIESLKEGFTQTPVYDRETASNVVKPAVRWCTNVWDIQAITQWFVPLLVSRIPELTRNLGLAPFEAEIRDCKVTRYGNGSFFGPHADRGAGVESRVFGFSYYCHFPPRRYSGGSLVIYDKDLETGGPSDFCTTLIPGQDQLLVLASDCWHEVLPVQCADKDWASARFALNGWIHRSNCSAGGRGI